MLLSTFTLLRNPISRITFILQKWNFIPIEQLSTSPSPSPWQSQFHFLSLWNWQWATSRKWNQAVFVFLWLVYFTLEHTACFLLGSLWFQALTSKSLINFEFIFVYGIKKSSPVWFFCMQLYNVLNTIYGIGCFLPIGMPP